MVQIQQGAEKILVHIDMIASHSGSRFASCTAMIRINQSCERFEHIPKVLIELRSNDCRALNVR